MTGWVRGVADRGRSGCGLELGRFLESGDSVALTTEGIGTLENTVVRNRLGDTTILKTVGPWFHRQFRRGSEPVPVPAHAG